MEAICGLRDDITPIVLLDSLKDDDHSDHSEGESINDTESSEIGKNMSMRFVFRYGNIGRSVMYFVNSPTLYLLGCAYYSDSVLVDMKHMKHGSGNKIEGQRSILVSTGNISTFDAFM